LQGEQTVRNALYKIAVIIIVCLTAALVTLRATGFEPEDCRAEGASWMCQMPGLWLKGDLVTTPVTDWSFTDSYQTLKIETRDWLGLPYSLIANCVAANGELYLTSSYRGGEEYPHGRRWNKNVARDPRVRLKIGNQLYERSVVHVTQPEIRSAVFQARAAKYPNVAPGGPAVQVFRVVDPRVPTEAALLPDR
jgi:hypothetical protein